MLVLEHLTGSSQGMNVSRLSNLSRRWRTKRQLGQALVCDGEAVKSSQGSKGKSVGSCGDIQTHRPKNFRGARRGIYLQMPRGCIV